MRTVAVILIIILLTILIYGFFEYRKYAAVIERSEAEIRIREKEVVSRYEAKLKELEDAYSSLLKKEVKSPSQKKRLAELQAKIKEMKEVIARWQETDIPDERNRLYRMCVEIYGNARGICESLKERR